MERFYGWKFATYIANIWNAIYYIISDWTIELIRDDGLTNPFKVLRTIRNFSFLWLI